MWILFLFMYNMVQIPQFIREIMAPDNGLFMYVMYILPHSNILMAGEKIAIKRELWIILHRCLPFVTFYFYIQSALRCVGQGWPLIYGTIYIYFVIYVYKTFETIYSSPVETPVKRKVLKYFLWEWKKNKFYIFSVNSMQQKYKRGRISLT